MQTLGFYYHTPARIDSGHIITAGYLGCFLDSLAPHVGELVLFLHGCSSTHTELDYAIRQKNIRFVALGRKPHASIRAVLGRRLVQPIREELSRCDALLLRAPTPMLSALFNLCRRTATLCVPLLVGDYAEGNKHLPFSFPKRQAVAALNAFINRQQLHHLRNRSILVNSSKLATKYRNVASAVYETRTTTLSNESFFFREDTCASTPLHLLYTGRYDWGKGLQTLLDAFAELVTVRGIDANLHLAGWQDSGGPSIEQGLQRQAESRGLGSRLTWHGKKKIGADLDTLYRMADIYILPSYAEGFPRTIWEAMANSLPVISTRVGAIPDVLTDGTNALLVDPRSAVQLADAVVTLTANTALRRQLIVNGRALASLNTLENRSVELVDYLKRIRTCGAT